MSEGRRIYLDHAATTPCRPEVVAAMLPLLHKGGNPSSLHAEGRRAHAALDDARALIAALIGAKPREIVFTGGGTESDNMAVLGVARALRERGRHVVTVSTEHHAVLHAVGVLRDEGWDVDVLDVDGDGRLSFDAFTAALRNDTVLASVMLANNEIGTLAPVGKLARSARSRGILFHSDAIAAAGQVPIDVDDLGVDLLSLSAHKFYGPAGAGLLYVRSGTPIAPIVYGGGQETGLRSGTENAAAVAGMAVALDLAVREMHAVVPRMAALRDLLQRGILAAVPGAIVSGALGPRLPSNLSVGFPNVDREALLVRLDLEGIAVSAGSACAAGAATTSHVIAALRRPDMPRAVLRFSLGRTTTEAQIGRVVACLPQTVAGAREFPAFLGTL